MATRTTKSSTPSRGTQPAARQPAAARQQTPQQNAVTPAKSTLPANINYGDMGGAGVGLEGADKDSFAIPFLAILQKLSPQLDRNAPEFIDGAKEGDILNTANQEIYDGEEGILAMPTAFKRSFTAWVIREKGGGFKGEYVPTDPVVMTTVKDVKNRQMLPNSDIQLVDTRLHAVTLLNGDTPQPALITMAVSQIKKSKRWMSQMQDVQRGDGLPTFAHIYRLHTVPESNDQGNWMGWAIEYVQPCADQSQIDAAVSFYKSIASGAKQMRADTGTVNNETVV